jgi:succinoglycan biosynthesis transport protein ExoP
MAEEETRVISATRGGSQRRELGMMRGTGAAGDQGESEISLSDLIRVLRRRKHIILISVAVVLLLGALYCALKTRRYEATADLAINPEGSDALDMGDITASLGGGGLGFDQKLETQVRILKSDSLAWTVMSGLRLDQQPAFAGYHKWIFWGPYIVPPAPGNIEQTSAERRNQLLAGFRQTLTVQTIARTQAVEITFRSPSATLAREIVNHLVTAYTERTFMTRYNDTMKASDWLSGQLVQLKSAIEKSQSQLARLQRQTGIFGSDENDNLVLSRLNDLSKELTDAEADRIVKEAKYRIAQSGNPELLGNIVPDSVLPVLRGQQADLKTQLAQADAEYGPRYPKVIQLNDQLAEVEESLKTEIANIQERFHTDYEASAGAERELRSAFDAQKQQALNMSEGLDQYGILKREVESGNDLYEDLLKKLKEAGVVASLKAATVDVIDPATLPTRPVEPDVPLVLALSLLLGLAAGVACTFAAENLDNLIRSSEEVEILTGVPLFPGVSPVEVGHCQPSQHARLREQTIYSAVQAGVKALDLTWCAFHAEVKVSPTGAQLIEIGARLGGDRISTHLTPLSTGVNLVRVAILLALGERPASPCLWKRAACVRYFDVQRAGTLRAVHGLGKLYEIPGVEVIYPASERDGCLREGFAIREIRSSLDRYGHLLYSAPTRTEAIARCELAASRVHFEFEDGDCRNGVGKVW